MRLAARERPRVVGVGSIVCLKGIGMKLGNKVQDAETFYSKYQTIEWVNYTKAVSAPRLEINKSSLYSRRVAQVAML